MGSAVFQVVDSTGKVLYQEPAAGSAPTAIDTLAAGATLPQGLRLYSANGQYYLVAQGESLGLLGGGTPHAHACM